jgi:plasmid stabilization system protein ParE
MPRSRSYRVHSQVWQEIEAADTWYLARSPEASVGFLTDVDDAFVSIRQAPQRWPKYLYGTRRFVLQRFPFSIIYLDDSGGVKIVAVAHSKRKPGYWKKMVLVTSVTSFPVGELLA